MISVGAGTIVVRSSDIPGATCGVEVHQARARDRGAVREALVAVDVAADRQGLRLLEPHQ
jgi:hypothetical protein